MQNPEKVQLRLKAEGLPALNDDSPTFAIDLVAPHPSVRTRAGAGGAPEPTGSARQRCEGSTCFLGKGAAAKSRCRGVPRGRRPESRLEEVQCESRRRLGLDRCQLPSLPQDGETKSLCSFSEARATCGIHLQQACEE